MFYCIYLLFYLPFPFFLFFPNITFFLLLFLLSSVFFFISFFLSFFHAFIFLSFFMFFLWNFFLSFLFLFLFHALLLSIFTISLCVLLSVLTFLFFSSLEKCLNFLLTALSFMSYQRGFSSSFRLFLFFHSLLPFWSSVLFFFLS